MFHTVVSNCHAWCDVQSMHELQGSYYIYFCLGKQSIKRLRGLTKRIYQINDMILALRCCTKHANKYISHRGPVSVLSIMQIKLCP